MKNSDANREAQAQNTTAQAEYVSEAQFAEETIDGRIWRKTITAKNIEAHPERAKLHGRPVVCCRIAGEVRGVEEVPIDPAKPQDGTLTVLVGEFFADSYNDQGEVFGYVGEWCGLPMGQNIILGRLQQMIDDKAESPVVRFDLEFAALPAGNPAGYSWGARNMMPVAINRQAFLSDHTMKQRRDRATAAGLPEFQRPAIEHKSPLIG